MHIVLRRTDIALSINCTLIARKMGGNSKFDVQSRPRQKAQSPLAKKHQLSKFHPNFEAKVWSRLRN